MRRTVIYVNDSPLLLDNIQRSSDGQILKAQVVNGAWEVSFKNGHLYVDGAPSFQVRTLEEYPVEDNGDYNAIIAMVDSFREKEAQP